MRLEDVQISALMTREPFTVHKEDSLAVAARLMDEHAVRHLPVVAEGWIDGVLSRSDLEAAGDDLHRPVSDLMRRPVVTARRQQPALAAARLMRQRRIGCLPVVDDWGWLVGIVTATDLVRVGVKLLARRVGSMTPVDVLDAMLAGEVAPSPAPPTDVPVHYYMSSPVRTVGRDDAVLAAAAEMRARRISSVVVLEEDRAVGVLSRSDLLGARAPAGALVSAWMTGRVITIAPGASIPEACAMMLEREVHQLVVVEDDRPVGVLAGRDTLAAARDLRLMDPASRWATATSFTVEHDQPVRLVLALLDQADLGSVLVMDGRFPVGVFGRRERMQIDAADLDRPVDALMSANVVVVPGELPLHRAAAQLHATGAELAAVVVAEAHYRVLSPSDVVRALAARGA